MLLSMFALSFLSILAQSTQTERNLIQRYYSGFVSEFGALDTLTVKASYSSDNKLYVISAHILNSNKSFLLKVDEKTDVTTYKKYLFETDLPKNLGSDSSTANGFAYVKSLDSDDNGYQVDVVRGVRTYTDGDGTEAGKSPLTDCIKRKIREMNWVEFAFFIAGEPESVGVLILICAWDVYH